MRRYSFQFTKQNNKFIWKNNEVKIVFSNSEIQAFNEYECIESKKGIMYLYYELEVFKKTITYNKSGEIISKKWVSISKTYVTDFPQIQFLIFALEEILHKDIPLEECQKIKYYCHDELLDRVGYEYTLKSSHMLLEDYYEISKTLIKEPGYKDIEDFLIYIGGVNNAGDRISSSGIKTNATRKDLEKLLLCAKEFMQYAIQEYNDKVREMNILALNAHHIINHKICTFLQNSKYHCVTDTMTSINVENDMFMEIIEINGDVKNNFTTNKYSNGKIVEIKEKEIIIECPYAYVGDEEIFETKTYHISIEKLLHCYGIDNDNIFFMSEKEIADDFSKILTNSELEEIKNCPIKSIEKKWSKVLIDRYCLGRPEHKYEYVKVKSTNYSEKRATLAANKIMSILNYTRLKSHGSYGTPSDKS